MSRNVENTVRKWQAKIFTAPSEETLNYLKLETAASLGSATVTIRFTFRIFQIKRIYIKFRFKAKSNLERLDRRKWSRLHIWECVASSSGLQTNCSESHFTKEPSSLPIPFVSIRSIDTVNGV
jgi:hypothetical protein